MCWGFRCFCSVLLELTSKCGALKRLVWSLTWKQLRVEQWNIFFHDILEPYFQSSALLLSNYGCLRKTVWWGLLPTSLTLLSFHSALNLILHHANLSPILCLLYPLFLSFTMCFHHCKPLAQQQGFIIHAVHAVIAPSSINGGPNSHHKQILALHLGVQIKCQLIPIPCVSPFLVF